MRRKFFGALAMSLALGLFVTSSALAEISDADFNKMLEKYLSSDAGQEAVGKAAQGYFKRLQEKAQKDRDAQAKEEVEEQFKNPVKIEINPNSPSIGPANAKVTIVEFSDFECPFCSRGKQTMDEVRKAFPNDVKIVFKNLPLPFHQNALPAAKAALAAAKQGKFWEMHDALFANQRNLSAEFFNETATKLGLNMEKFKADMESPEITKQIEEDQALAKTHGISGTPGFFVNGVAVKGAYPFDHFKQIIDRWLSGSGAEATKKG